MSAVLVTVVVGLAVAGASSSPPQAASPSPNSITTSVAWRANITPPTQSPRWIHESLPAGGGRYECPAPGLCTTSSVRASTGASRPGVNGSGAASGAGGRYPGELCGRSWLNSQRQRSTSTCASHSVRSRNAGMARGTPAYDRGIVRTRSLASGDARNVTVGLLPAGTKRLRPCIAIVDPRAWDCNRTEHTRTRATNTVSRLECRPAIGIAMRGTCVGPSSYVRHSSTAASADRLEQPSFE